MAWSRERFFWSEVRASFAASRVAWGRVSMAMPDMRNVLSGWLPMPTSRSPCDGVWSFARRIASSNSSSTSLRLSARLAAAR
jgi:hypothetical protein